MEGITGEDGQVVVPFLVHRRLAAAQGRIVQSGPQGPQKTTTKSGTVVESVDLKAQDGGFNEWLNVFWLPRVYDGKPHGVQVRMAPAPGPIKTIVDGEGAKQFVRLPDEGGKPVHKGLQDVPAERTKPGGYFSDGTAIATCAQLPSIDGARCGAAATCTDVTHEESSLTSAECSCTGSTIVRATADASAELVPYSFGCFTVLTHGLQRWD